MTIAYFCVMIAGILPIVWVGYAKMKLRFNLKKDNANPREILASANGAAKRANWAQENSWESFAPFAAAVIIASIAGASQNKIDTVAITFVIVRLLYGIFYILDQPALRSSAWTIGWISNFVLYYLAWNV